MKIQFHKMFLTLFFVLMFIVSNSKSKATENEIKTVTIMTFNVENLFDTKDDDNKSDETYLPVKQKNKNPILQKKCNSISKKEWRSECKNLNWDDRALKSKMNRLADVILKSHKGVGPDVLILQEVENLNVIENLRLLELKSYYPNPAILLEGPDERGIDVAILTKLNVSTDPKNLPKLHIIPFKPDAEMNFIPVSRGILEVNLILPDQTPLTVFGVHFPSQGSPTQARKQALRYLTELMDKKPSDSLIIAGGDFNITAQEEEKQEYFGKLKEKFMVSHFVGCSQCKGTQYYPPQKSWSFLDVLIFSNSFRSPKTKWSLSTESVRVFNQNLYQNNKWGSPMKFNLGKNQQGVSDHWPLLADIVLNSSRSKGTLK